MNSTCEKTVLIGPDASSLAWIRRRAESLGIPCQPLFRPDVVQTEPSTARWVYMVAWETLQKPIWNKLRVALASSGRQFLVAGKELSSEQFRTAFLDGAWDVVEEHEDAARWRRAFERAVQAQQAWTRLYCGQVEMTHEILAGRSTAIESIRKAVARLGPTDVNVLILGESGAGKERVALALHHASGRHPFLAINCAAIPRDLLEAELFGVEKGAYTGAAQARPGLVEQAAGGTLFLDEVGEMSPALQAKLLRFIETRQARRVGGRAEYTASARVLAATNRDIKEAVASGSFRADLYYRVGEITLTVPPLRERPDDIPVLAQLFLQQANERFGKNFISIDPKLMEKFTRHSWPGNARELKSHIDRLVVLFDGSELKAEWWSPSRWAALPENLLSEPAGPKARAARGGGRSARLQEAKALLAQGNLSLTEVAAKVGVHPSTLFRWRKTGKV